jgi:CRP-like cAMP-binding protein
VDREHALFRLFGKFCPEGTILYTEGSTGQEAFVIQSGAVRLGAARPEGGGRTVLLGPGDLLGEGALSAGTRRLTRAVVVQDARLIQVSDRTLDAVVRHGPQTARQIFDQLLERTRIAKGDLHGWLFTRLVPRLAQVLTEAAGAGAVPADLADLADLAEQSGLSEADVLLVLEELCERGCLVREAGRFRAPDPARLQREIDASVDAAARS